MIFDNTSSCEENVTYGVPQGSILGPLLFGLIINDIHIPLTDADIILYADDTVYIVLERTQTNRTVT